jgi:hypothetical protein
MNSTKAFNREILRFSLNAQKECLENILSSVNDDTKTCGPVYRDRIVAKLSELNDQLTKCGGGSRAPRKLSPYNRFVKEQLPLLVKDHPEMDNKARMTHVSSMWKKMSAADKEKY